MNNEEKILGLLETVNARLDTMDQRFDTMDQRFDKMDQRFDTMDQRFDKMESELDFVKAAVVRIENDHGKKLDALFDGYQQLNEKTDRIEKHVSAQDEVILKRVFPMAANK